MATGESNIDHVLANNCTDPDCELHNPAVAVEEEVIGNTDLAFFYAGATEMLAHLKEMFGIVFVDDEFLIDFQHHHSIRYHPHLES